MTEMSEEYTITKKKILDAAESCSAAKDVLKAMFPEAFAEVDPKSLWCFKPNHAEISFLHQYNENVEVRVNHYKDGSIFLNSHLKTDDPSMVMSKGANWPKILMHKDHARQMAKAILKVLDGITDY